MNLEKDVSPTGLYNYLPKLSEAPRSRKQRKPVKKTRRRASKKVSRRRRHTKKSS